MANTIELENIEEMRRQEGIDDIELRQEIHRLEIGDLVKLTLLASNKSFETLCVRITRIRGTAFRGKLASKPACAGLCLQAGAAVSFTAAHIHSIPKGRPTDEQ
jgi:hypothetical protein